MKEVKYIAKEEVNFGRFGIIRKGRKLSLFENEYDCLKDDNRFKLLTPKPSNDELKIAARIKPWATGICDLRTIPWEKANLQRLLLARFSKKRLVELLRGMSEVGCRVREFSTKEQKLDLVDVVIETGRYHSWPSITVEERYKLDTFTNVEAQEGLTDSNERDAKKDTDKADSKQTDKPRRRRKNGGRSKSKRKRKPKA